ncbi:MAG: hypothetical protein MUC92_01950 [Fimbriimonadaceae bacterium]|jgi:hypothetical protein|nr:hypothetical protein [Fimbriimonadaceae bacterium]
MDVKKIGELKELKKQLAWWKWSFVGIAAAVVGICWVTIDGAFRGLATQGPKQEKFLAELQTGLREDVAPLLEDLAKQTMNEVKPEVEASINRVNERLPELAEASMSELESLQTSLPKRAEKVLEKTFVTMLMKKEEQLQKMFPEATEEQIERLLTNLAESSVEQVGVANDELFAKHQEQLFLIVSHLERIREIEGANIETVDPSWEMGILVLDLFREDLNRMRPDKAQVQVATTASTKDPVKTKTVRMEDTLKVKK